MYDAGTVYYSPYVTSCCYVDVYGNKEYLTFRKEKTIEIEYTGVNEYNLKYTNSYLETLNLFDEVDTLEKDLILQTGNFIKFPLKLIKVYNPEGDLITIIGDMEKINLPSLIAFDKTVALENIKRQNNRLGTNFSYDSIDELKNRNKCFGSALSFYYSSFAVNDSGVGFILLMTALESLLSMSTYAKVKQCNECGQQMYKITSTVSKNTSLVLMDESLESRMKKLYGKRSKFVHEGSEDISQQDEQELKEYVRKVLLMYWYVSITKSTFEHKEIVETIQSDEYKNNTFLKSFLVFLENVPIEKKRINIITDIVDSLTKNIRQSMNEGEN